MDNCVMNRDLRSPDLKLNRLMHSTILVYIFFYKADLGMKSDLVLTNDRLW